MPKSNAVAVFTEALRSTGLGHVARCTALAETLSDAGHDVRIGLHSDIEKATDFSYVDLLDWKHQASLKRFPESAKPHTAIVDSYLADPVIYDLLHQQLNQLICLDDTSRVEYPPNSIILNPGFGGMCLKYNRANHTVLTGPEYVLLRQSFKENVRPRQINSTVQSILITMGGGRPA